MPMVGFDQVRVESVYTAILFGSSTHAKRIAVLVSSTHRKHTFTYI